MNGDQVQELSPELEAIRARAAAADAASTPPVVAAEAQAGGSGAVAGNVPAAAAPAPTFAQELAGMMFALGSMCAMRFPSLKTIYTQENCNQVANDVAPACEKLGWTFTGGDGMVYIKAGGAVLMLAVATRDAVLKDLAQEKIAAAANGAQPNDRSPAPGGEPVSPGPVVHDQMRLYT